MSTPSFDLESLRSGLFRSTSSNNNLAGSAAAGAGVNGGTCGGGSGKAALGYGYFVLNNGGLLNSMIEVPDDDEVDEGGEEYDCDGSGCGTNGDLEQLKIQRSLKRPLPSGDDTSCVSNDDGDCGDCDVSAMSVDDIV
ncbi:unnamed protein product [Ambrosiozyma monospora]|uniref:Unnamed protein product n=1 Tax=Ambrosiozyma monospora TaxID=43982 RepID=A0ACB5UD96_AMBMO|nr:unnamed protein product [Ambrosiozyma monospora]